jgi:hypothetical protein
LRRGRYFERIVAEVRRGVTGAGGTPEAEGLLRLLLLASVAQSISEAYDAEILHRGSSRRGSRRASCRGPIEPQKFAEGPGGFQSRYAEGRRRLSVMSTQVADKLGVAMRTDLARGLAYALLPCASALAFLVYSYAKRYNEIEE